MRITLDQLRRYAIARSLFEPTTLGRAIAKLGFVQADPIRAPARAQDLTLRHRVLNYAVGDLERRYPRLRIEEDFFVNYGFLPRSHQALMHPRVARARWSPARVKKAQAVLEFIREHGPVHPRVVDAHFAHGKITNWFGGSSNATTHLLDDMHYRGMLRIARRESGTRIYAIRETLVAERLDAATASARFDALVDVVMNKYAPLTAASLGYLMSLLCRGAPQWRSHRGAALARAKRRFAHSRLDGIDWYWPAGESPRSARWRLDDEVRLLAPFDPVVWDRRRFTIFWDWVYRFEAYTPAPKRKLGYYALPVLWRGRIVGWGNLSVTEGALGSTFGYVDPSPPRDTAFQAGLEAELARMNVFLRLGAG
ncbi:MAG TPA: crosslink repair DNA glycosylase YcaQ family protein [Steroidobacteraceae bacterium]|nr:crosslink repair DNA glycosylase YcaQ family protein [Steroidobacteraceae bacterium]